MNVPFTQSQFLEVFQHYNLSVFPMQVILILFAIGAIVLSINKRRNSGIIISIILSFFWLWMGVVYHLLHFTHINKAAYVFGIIYIIQAGLFFYFGIIRKSISFRYQSNIYGLLGLLLIVFALIIYPILGYIFGHMYPQSPTFGLPCPTTIFTFGILLWSESKVPVWLLVIPLLWSLIGFTAALSLGIFEDVGLLVAGLLATFFILMRNRKIKNEISYTGRVI
jgi:hypothetical protein